MPSSDFVPLGGSAGSTAERSTFRGLADGDVATAASRPAERSPEPFGASAAVIDVTPAAAAAPAMPSPERLEDQPAYRAGFAAGQATARADLDAMEATLARSLDELATFQCELRTRYERELLEVALGVARKVVQHELQERPQIWLGMIRAAVHQAVERDRIVVRVPPALGASLRARLAELRAALEEVKELEIQDDPALPPGGCVVESRWGDADIGVESQLAAAERALVRAES